MNADIEGRLEQQNKNFDGDLGRLRATGLHDGGQLHRWMIGFLDGRAASFESSDPQGVARVGMGWHSLILKDLRWLISPVFPFCIRPFSFPSSTAPFCVSDSLGRYFTQLFPAPLRVRRFLGWNPGAL